MVLSVSTSAISHQLPADKHGPEVHLKGVMAHAKFGMKVSLDLNKAVWAVKNSRITAKGLVVNATEPKATIIVYKNGTLQCAGAQSETNARLALSQMAKTLQKLHPEQPLKFQGFCVDSFMGTATLPFAINRYALAAAQGLKAFWEPELDVHMVQCKVHVAATGVKATVGVSAGGRINVMGAKQLSHLQAALDHLYPTLMEHSCPFPAPEEAPEPAPEPVPEQQQQHQALKHSASDALQHASDDEPAAKRVCSGSVPAAPAPQLLAPSQPSVPMLVQQHIPHVQYGQYGQGVQYMQYTAPGSQQYAPQVQYGQYGQAEQYMQFTAPEAQQYAPQVQCGQDSQGVQYMQYTDVPVQQYIPDRYMVDQVPVSASRHLHACPAAAAYIQPPVTTCAQSAAPMQMAQMSMTSMQPQPQSHVLPPLDLSAPRSQGSGSSSSSLGMAAVAGAQVYPLHIMTMASTHTLSSSQDSSAGLGLGLLQGGQPCSAGSSSSALSVQALNGSLLNLLNNDDDDLLASLDDELAELARERDSDPEYNLFLQELWEDAMQA